MQLNIAAGDFEEMWQWTKNTASHPIDEINALAYNVIDDIVYGMFSPQYPTPSTGYLCRFSHVQDSAVCLCEVNTPTDNGNPATVWGNAGTITKDGTYYLGREGGTYLLSLENVAALPSPPPSTPVTDLGNCNMVQIQRGRGASITITNWALSVSDLDVLYGIDPADSSATRSYRNGVWTGGGGTPFTKWTPGAQNYADYIDFEHNGITYLVGLGASDGSVAMIRLDSDGDFDGYAYSRVMVDYTGSSSTVRTMSGFGAG